MTEHQLIAAGRAIFLAAPNGYSTRFHGNGIHAVTKEGGRFCNALNAEYERLMGQAMRIWEDVPHWARDRYWEMPCIQGVFWRVVWSGTYAPRLTQQDTVVFEGKVWRYRHPCQWFC